MTEIVQGSEDPGSETSSQVVAVVYRKHCVQCGKDLGLPRDNLTAYMMKKYCSKKCGFEARKPNRELSKQEREERWKMARACGMTWGEVDEVEYQYKLARHKFGKEVAEAEFIQNLEQWRALKKQADKPA